MSQIQIDQVLSQIRTLGGHQDRFARPTESAAGGFGQMLKQGIDAVNRSQESAATLADAYERGVGGVDLAQVMLETQKASVSFRALAEVRNRLVGVYQEIMNMPI